MGPLYESDQSAKGVAASATVLLASIEPRHSCPTSSIQRSKLCPVPRIRGRNPATHYNIPVPTSSSPRPLRHSRAHFVIPAPTSSFPRRRESRGGMGGAIGPVVKDLRTRQIRGSKVPPPLPRRERIEVRVKRLPRHQPPSRKQRQPIVEREKCSAGACPQPRSPGHPAGESRPHHIIPAPTLRHAHAGGNPRKASTAPMTLEPTRQPALVVDN